MLTDTIKILAATPPPTQRLWKFKTARSAHTRICELESKLGLPQSPFGYNLTLANLRICELEAMASSQSKAIAPCVVAPVAAPVAEKLGRERFNSSVRAAAAAKPKSQSRPELHGRDRFMADTRVSASVQILSANKNPIPAGLKGRERFKAALAKDFGSKQ